MGGLRFWSAIVVLACIAHWYCLGRGFAGTDLSKLKLWMSVPLQFCTYTRVRVKVLI